MWYIQAFKLIYHVVEVGVLSQGRHKCTHCIDTELGDLLFFWRDSLMTESVYNVQEVAGKGMGCVATKDIKKGSLVLREKPALFIEKQDPKSCFKSFSMMISENQETNLALYNAYDCDSTEWSSAMRLSHEDTCNWISGLGANDLSGLSQEMAVTVWQVCLTNSFDNGVCLNTSRFNHSCNANGHNFWETKTETRELRAWRDIKQGEEITLTYKVFGWRPERSEGRY